MECRKEESQVDYQQFFNRMAEGFALYDAICDEHGKPCDCRLLDANPAFEKIAGAKREDIFGKRYSEIFPGEDLSWLEMCKADTVALEPTKLEVYLPITERHCEVTAYRPSPGQVAMIFTDISERKEIEKELSKREAMIGALLDSVTDRILHIAENGTILDCRASPESELHARREQLIGKRIHEVLPPDILDQAFFHMKRAQETGDRQAFSCNMMIGEREHSYEARASVLFEGEFILLVRDISKQKRMAEALMEGNRQFRAAIDSVPYLLVVFDEKLRLRYANRAAIQMTGLVEGELFGHTVEDVLPPEIVRPFIEYLKKAQETKSIQKVEYTYDLPCCMQAFSSTFVPLANEPGDVAHILAISHDITERKKAERRLKSALEENRKQNRLLKIVVEEMKDNYDEAEQLLYKISHDLIAPLITIDGFMGLLKKDVEKCNRIRIEIDIGLISDAISRMRNHLSEALELSSLGMLSGEAEVLPFEEIVDAARMHLKDTGIWSDLVITEDERFPPVCMSRRRMEDVLMSMIEGCIRCSGETSAPRVHVGWRTDDEGPVFYTSCKGSGELKDGARAFKLCTDEDSADNCTSIGLAVSKRIIELQGGRMWMECSHEGGCSILFTLPEKG